MARSDLTGFLTGYEKRDKSERIYTDKSFYSKKISGTVTLEMKRFLDSRPLKAMRSAVNRFAYATAKTYGIFLLSFGLISLIIQFVKDYFGIFGGLSLSSLIIGAALAALSIPLLLVDEPISIMLQRFKLTEIIFFEFFCIKRLYHTGSEKTLHPIFAVFTGTVLAVLGLWLPLWWILLAFGIVLFVALTFLSPEFAFFSSLLLLPFLPLIPGYTAIIALTAVLGSASFIRKAIFGKRVISIEQYDLIIGIMSFVIFLRGAFGGSKDAFVGAAVMSLMSLGFFLSGNVVTNRRLADCALNAVVISSLPASLVSISVFFYHISSGEPLLFLEKGISSTLSAPGAAAAFFLVAVMFSLALAKESHGGARGTYIALLVLNFIALILTGKLFAVVALIVAALAYYALKFSGWTACLLPLLFAAPYLMLLIPEDTLSRLPSALYADGTATVFKAALQAFADNPMLGVGIGGESFAEVMSEYGVSGFRDSGNLFLELALEAGIFSLIMFAILLVVRLVHRAVYQRYVSSSQLSKLSPMVSSTIFVLLVYGCFDYIFADPSIFYLFLCVFGIGGASLRVCKQEYDDRVLYFENEKSSTSSVVNIRIR